MIEVRQTDVFAKWFQKLRDQRAKNRIVVRIRRMELGNPGDVKSVGGGVQEARISYGPGYRLYFTREGDALIILLCGGNKSSQAKDIARAKEIRKHL
ncbi:MAG: type II toxin-antitoxin system RelE/ParE family toxin [Pseudomonadota bacterium]